MSEQQMDLPPLFSKKGVWVGYDDAAVETLEPTRRTIYTNLRDEVAQLDEVEVALKAAQSHVVATANEIREVEAMKPKPMTQHELWVQHFGRGSRT